MSYTCFEIQDISSEFRNVARRLSRTDYSQCDTNLKRFMAIVQTNQMISEFIHEKNTTEYDIATILRSREWLEPFNISTDINEEISFEYQLLIYALQNFDGDFTRLYGTHFYTSAKSTANDEMSKFIKHITAAGWCPRSGRSGGSCRLRSRTRPATAAAQRARPPLSRGEFSSSEPLLFLSSLFPLRYGFP